MITYAMLREASLTALDELARSWERFGRECGVCRDDWEQQVLGRLSRSYWTGPAAVQARQSLERYDDFLELRAGFAGGLALALDQAGVRLGDLQRQLQSIVDLCVAAGYTITGTGEVWRAGADRAPISQLGRHIAALVARANALDEQVTAVLRRFVPERAGELTAAEWRRLTDGMRGVAILAGAATADIPPDGQIEAARAWWTGLTPAQRTLYEQAYPERVGTLDGLPVTVRDSANRLVLRIAASAASSARAHDRAEALIRRLEAAQYEPIGLYLLDIDNSSADGTAVVSVGNPDVARHQVVIVPGVNSAVDRISADIDRAARLQVTADFMAGDPTGDVAVIAWLGYDAPGQNLGALSGRAAAAGAPELNQFVDLLQASDHSHVTVVGHSYGSVVIGTAAASGGLHADEIITAGSPGMGVGGVTDLRLDPRHVWAGAAKDDDVSGWMSHFAHDLEPHTDAFGANRFVVDTRGHNNYWDVNTISLKNQAAIVVGQYDRVSLEHGALPSR